MANYKLLIPHMMKWEGGWSSDPKDTARSFATKTIYKGYPVHTNKGVTFRTWVDSASKLGHPKDEKAFLNMTNDQWGKIMKTYFWDKVYGDRIQSQAIAEILTEIVWGSWLGGLKPCILAVQNFLKSNGFPSLKTDGDIGTNTVNAINDYCIKNGTEGAKKLYDIIWQVRKKELAGYSTATTHLTGWLNRMNDHYNALKLDASKFFTQNPVKSSLISVFFVVTGVFFLTKIISNRKSWQK